MELEVVAKMPGFSAAKYGPVAICCWDSPPTEEQGRFAVKVLSTVARQDDKMFTLAIVGRDTPPPPGVVRDMVGVEMTRISKNIVGAATVVEGVGFRAATMRAVVTGMALVMRPAYLQRVCVTVEEASEFLAAESERRFTPTGLSTSILELRR